MTNEQLIQKLSSDFEDNHLFPLTLSSEEIIAVYPKSINRLNGDFLFLARKGIDKRLYIISLTGRNSNLEKFEGTILKSTQLDSGTSVKQCPMNHHNANTVRELFDYTKPILIGLQDSIGLGDRLGIANPAHLRAVAGTGIKAVLAQQSIRELERTQRRPEEVMDAATWAVFQEGYKDGFGADADHLKTTEDVDLMVKAGFTMFTFDPGAYVVNEADSLPLNEILERVQSLPWELLNDAFENFVSRYAHKHFSITDDFSIQPDKEQVLRGLLKYGGVIAHTVKLYRYLKEKYPEYPFELELSVDETESVTSPFEHFMIANELKRLAIKLVSLAPRFIGDFEKGIDYKGDLDQFRKEYLKHIKITNLLGPYKISIHSGSDKFSVYKVIGSLKQGHVHVKTAGTSYLEALRTIAAEDTSLFREILDFSLEQYGIEKATYHVSADIEKVPTSNQCSDAQLLELFEQDDARQVLHVTFGKVLTSKNEAGKYIFRERILNSLREHEDIHYAYLQQHFQRHVRPFI